MIDGRPKTAHAWVVRCDLDVREAVGTEMLTEAGQDLLRVLIWYESKLDACTGNRRHDALAPRAHVARSEAGDVAGRLEQRPFHKGRAFQAKHVVLDADRLAERV